MILGMHPDRIEYLEYAERVDEATKYLSGGYERENSYKFLRGLGAEIVPNLIEDLQEKRGDWWRIQMIGELAARDLGQCIYYPENIRGRFRATIDQTLEWWKNSGKSALEEVRASDTHNTL